MSYFYRMPYDFTCKVNEKGKGKNEGQRKYRCHDTRNRSKRPEQRNFREKGDRKKSGRDIKNPGKHRGLSGLLCV